MDTHSIAWFNDVFKDELAAEVVLGEADKCVKCGNTELYSVADCDGNLIGHDMSYEKAQDCLNTITEREPDKEWEILTTI